MQDIALAKDELFNSLKNYNEVLGASIRSANGNKYIVILLSRLTKKIKARIPESYMGSKVTHEVIGQIKAF